MAEQAFSNAVGVTLGNSANSIFKMAVAAIDKEWKEGKVDSMITPLVFPVFFAQFGKVASKGSRSISFGNIVLDIFKTYYPEYKPDLHASARTQIDSQNKAAIDPSASRLNREFIVLEAVYGKDEYYLHIRNAVKPLFTYLRHATREAVTYEVGSVTKKGAVTEQTRVWKHLVPEAIARGKITSLVGCGNHGLYFPKCDSSFTVARLTSAVASLFSPAEAKVIHLLPTKTVVSVYMINTEYAKRTALQGALAEIATAKKV